MTTLDSNYPSGSELLLLASTHKYSIMNLIFWLALQFIFTFNAFYNKKHFIESQLKAALPTFDDYKTLTVKLDVFLLVAWRNARNRIEKMNT